MNVFRKRNRHFMNPNISYPIYIYIYIGFCGNNFPLNENRNNEFHVLAVPFTTKPKLCQLESR